ncbi:MAG: flagellin [Agathobacter sp.]|uniref:flagellin N-terminal helical domain-containing protein n=1 Tax=Agathobacter sp. TaxID=2021311 RepID=UPI002E7A86BA|nr:flagellin [Agathobacter sp.]MEE1217410.1 flagellin [Agathobacter sp.]
MVVQHNMQAANANRMLNVTTSAQSKSTEKLSSGYRINRAADDAAGLTISEKMRKQIKGLDRASTNAQDGVSAVQTAEGALTEVHSMLQRMNELATQSANGTNSETDRKAIQDEVDQLTTEIDRVSETTKFNETYLLKGDSKTTKDVNFYKSGYAMPNDLFLEGSTSKITNTDDLKAALAAGKKVYKEAAAATGTKQADNLIAKKGIDYAYVTKLYDGAGKELSADEAAAATGEVYADKDQKVKVADTGAAAKTAGFITTETVNDDLKFNLHVGADSEMTNKIGVTIQSMSSAGIGVKGLDVSTEDDATNAIDTITNAIQKVSSQRSSLGAVQNRLEHTINNLDNVVENTTSAESRIRDTDMAKEMVNYSKNNILAQAGQSMLAQANQSNQGVLSLLQ